jgi:hypothetical protein
MKLTTWGHLLDKDEIPRCLKCGTELRGLRVIYCSRPCAMTHYRRRHWWANQLDKFWQEQQGAA